MFKQTTCLSFEKYGSILTTLPDDLVHYEKKSSIKLLDKSVDLLYSSNTELYIKLKSGVVLIITSKDSNFRNIESFVLNGRIKLNKGIYYNFIPVSDNCSVDLFGESPFSDTINLSQSYTYKEIVPTILINKIYTKFYQEKSTNYLFNGEKHNFWELTYVDRGVLYTQVNNIEYKLTQGDLFFYAPNEYHTQYTDDKKSCSYLTVSFNMDFNDASLISNKIFSSNKEIYNIISKLMKELNSTHLYCDELSICYLKELVLKILSIDFESSIIKPVNKVQQYYDDELLNSILNFINDNVYEYLDIKAICDKFNISGSKLHLLFRKNLDTTVKLYINDLKLKKSKELIKESNYTISEISEILRFNSIHYFSNKFKKVYGFSPTEYLKSINKNY
ncbi:MAG: AraC family transcriptional regulator [Romboutsia sp.]